MKAPGLVDVASRPGDPPGSRRERISATLRNAILAEPLDARRGCITALRRRALAARERLIVEDRVQCPFNPVGPDRPHEFTATCLGCGDAKCPHCDCHVV